MKRSSVNSKYLFILILVTLMFTGCDQLEKVVSGVGGASKSATEKISNSNGSDSSAQPKNDSSEQNGNAEENTDPGNDSEKIEVAAEQSTQERTTVRLDAFRHFNCSSGWTNRDGGLGLRAGSGSGICRAAFPGPSGLYRVVLMAQLEFDGNPNFKISVDGSTIAAGSYPMSKGQLICNCPNWRINCPDRIVPIDAGIHEIGQGASIEFFGQEVYPCGGSHGAYAKWREIVLTPVN